MSANERPDFSLKKGVGLRPVAVPAPTKDFVKELIDPKLVPDEEVTEGQGSMLVAQTAVSAPAETPVSAPEPAPHPTVPATRTRLNVQPGQRRKKRPKSVTTNFRFPTELLDELTRLAKYNNVTRTAIILESLEMHMPNLPQPPADWKASEDDE